MLTLFKGSEKDSEKSSEKVLMLINKNPKTTATEIAKILAITPRAVEKVIAGLKAAGKLKRIGPAKGGYWEVNSRQ